MGVIPIQVVAWYVTIEFANLKFPKYEMRGLANQCQRFAPMALGGFILGITGEFVLHLLPGTVFLTVAGLGWIVAPVLFAVAPAGANYWAYIFPSMICATIGKAESDMTVNEKEDIRAEAVQPANGARPEMQQFAKGMGVH